jgi:RNA recognition motif-containing protein
VSIFVGNLPFRAEQEDVIEIFSPFGTVVNCSLPLERDTGRKRGFAFVEMADPEMESRAIEGLQGVELMGRPLRINKAEPRGSGAPRRSHTPGGSFGGGHAVERGSGTRGWEDRSLADRSGQEAGEGLLHGRTRRRRSSGATGADHDSSLS